MTAFGDGVVVFLGDDRTDLTHRASEVLNRWSISGTRGNGIERLVDPFADFDTKWDLGWSIGVQKIGIGIEECFERRRADSGRRGYDDCVPAEPIGQIVSSDKTIENMVYQRLPI